MPCHRRIGPNFLFITILALRFGRQARELKIAPIWFSVLLLAGIFAGKNGMGMVLPISVLAANLPQLWVAHKEGNLADLSLGTWLLSITDGFVWGAYALIQQDISILVFAFFQLTTSGLIVTLKFAYINRTRIKEKIGIIKT
jgi:uncharacterized protein with PQ loop repeat